MKLFDLLNTYAMAVPSCLIRGKDDRNLARMWDNWHMIPLELLRTKVYSWSNIREFFTVSVVDEILKKYTKAEVQK